MKQRPIIQTAEPVRAIIEGRRTQIRVPITFSLQRVYDEDHVPIMNKLRRMCPLG